MKCRSVSLTCAYMYSIQRLKPHKCTNIKNSHLVFQWSGHKQMTPVSVSRTLEIPPELVSGTQENVLYTNMAI